MYQIKTDDDTIISVEDINPRSPDTIMMVHGWPMERAIFEYQTTYFARNGFRCLLPDLRGFGCSSTPSCDYTYDRMAKDLFCVIRQLRPRNLTLLGFDMGGAIAARYMTKTLGYGVCRLALVAAALPSFTRRLGCDYGMQCTTMNELISLAITDRTQLVVQYTAMFYKRQPAAAAKRRVESICMDNTIIATIECAKTLLRENLENELCDIMVPTGIFVGKDDIVTPIELAFMQKDNIVNSQLFEFDNAGHMLIQEQSECFNETLLHFISKF